jgi:hypothetical protein
MSTWSQAEAEKAFSSVSWAHRRASLICRLRGLRHTGCDHLPVYEQGAGSSAARATRGVREIPLDSITGTTEPNRAAQFDWSFRPKAPTRGRWQRVWLAEHRGTVLPPISVVQVGSGYAIRDGHHRVSVAKARGALTIDAIVATT